MYAVFLRLLRKRPRAPDARDSIQSVELPSSFVVRPAVTEVLSPRSFAPSNSCAAHKLSDFPLALISIDGPLSIAKLLSQNLNHNQSRSQSFARKLRARPETERERKEKAEKAKLFNDVKYKVFCLVAGASNLSKL